MGRNTQGVRLINLKDDQKVATVAVLDKEEIEEEETILEEPQNNTETVENIEE